MFRALIVEDEPLSRRNLSNILSEFFPDVPVVGTAVSEEEALSLINDLRPDILFLDIELQTGNGFGVVEKMPDYSSNVIFTTAVDHYSIQLLELSGVPYLQKPIDIDGISGVLNSLESCRHQNANAISHLRATIKNDCTPISIYTGRNDHSAYVSLAHIIRIEASGTKSILYIHNHPSVVMDKELRELEMLLGNYGFFRTHAMHIVNTAALADEVGEVTDTITMKDGALIPISPKKVASFYALLGQ